MGAHNIEFEMDGTPSFLAIEKQFKKQRADDNHENGNGSYSGDFQTVHEVKDHTEQTFDSYNEAHEYCMKNAQKWEFVVAVRYRFMGEGFKFSAKVEKLKGKLEALLLQRQTLDRAPVKLRKFETCEGCCSTVSTSHIRGTKCPVCGEGDFRPLGIQRKLRMFEDRIKLAELNLKTQRDAERVKGMKKFGKVGTLVAGWGAS